jgi:hypothetical protein
MGGDLRNPPDGQAPRFMVCALRDLDGANLDQIEVIKGWLDARGESHDRHTRSVSNQTVLEPVDLLGNRSKIVARGVAPSIASRRGSH